MKRTIKNIFPVSCLIFITLIDLLDLRAAPSFSLILVYVCVLGVQHTIAVCHVSAYLWTASGCNFVPFFLGFLVRACLHSC